MKFVSEERSIVWDKSTTVVSCPISEKSNTLAKEHLL